MGGEAWTTWPRLRACRHLGAAFAEVQGRRYSSTGGYYCIVTACVEAKVSSEKVDYGGMSGVNDFNFGAVA
jgi:hypothetical protein